MTQGVCVTSIRDVGRVLCIVTHRGARNGSIETKGGVLASMMGNSYVEARIPAGGEK